MRILNVRTHAVVTALARVFFGPHCALGTCMGLSVGHKSVRQEEVVIIGARVGASCYLIFVV